MIEPVSDLQMECLFLHPLYSYGLKNKSFAHPQRQADDSTEGKCQKMLPPISVVCTLRCVDALAVGSELLTVSDSGTGKQKCSNMRVTYEWAYVFFLSHFHRISTHSYGKKGGVLFRL